MSTASLPVLKLSERGGADHTTPFLALRLLMGGARSVPHLCALHKLVMG